MGDIRAEVLSAIRDGGQAAFSLLPDVGTASSSFLGSFVCNFLKKKKKKDPVIFGSSSFFLIIDDMIALLHSERLLQPLYTVYIQVLCL